MMVVNFQEYERRLHDTRLPGQEIAESYLDWLEQLVASEEGVLLVIEEDREFLGYAACVVVNDNVIAETPDSNRYGQVMDTYVVEGHRGRGLAAELLAAVEGHLKAQNVTRMRISALANNSSAIQAYLKFGFGDYEVTLEKRIG
jgi:ribosomal protein S18 acetylase RimI-like enzyme